MTSTNGNDIMSKIQAWASPTLLVIIGFFAKGKLDSIDNKIEQIASLQMQQAVMSVRIDHVEDDMKLLSVKFEDHLIAVKSEEVTLEKLKKP